jgi:TATA-binding protein-associated factor Taf7
MKLDQKTIDWIEEAIGDIQYGQIVLSICEKRIAKVVVMQHTLKGKLVDMPQRKEIDLE